MFTCLSSDIVNHEFGHAVLDGLRPHYYESLEVQTAAFTRSNSPPVRRPTIVNEYNATCRQQPAVQDCL